MLSAELWILFEFCQFSHFHLFQHPSRALTLHLVTTCNIFSVFSCASQLNLQGNALVSYYVSHVSVWVYLMCPCAVVRFCWKHHRWAVPVSVATSGGTWCHVSHYWWHLFVIMCVPFWVPPISWWLFSNLHTWKKERRKEGKKETSLFVVTVPQVLTNAVVLSSPVMVQHIFIPLSLILHLCSESPSTSHLFNCWFVSVPVVSPEWNAFKISSLFVFFFFGVCKPGLPHFTAGWCSIVQM